MEAVNLMGGRSSSFRPLALVRAARQRASRWTGPVFGCALLFFIVIFLADPPSVAQSVHPTESQVKAAYLYNFGKFVRWQADRVPNSGLLEICILGKDPFGAVLDSTIAGESIDGRNITVKRITKVQEAASCSVLFISVSEAGKLPPILAAAQRFNALTVGDLPHFVDQGGMIGFVMQEGRIRFEVNRTAAEESHLLLSSELLKIATKVIDKSVPGN